MGLVRSIRVRLGFYSGSLVVVRIAKTTDDELIFPNGSSVKALDEWKSKSLRGYGPNSICRNYAILKHGRFMGIIVSVMENGDISATNVINGKSPIGWSNPDRTYVDYCKEIMASDFGAESECLMSI